MGFNAAKVTVDYWRNVYSLNYEVLTFKGALPSNGVTEPSVSQCISVTPRVCQIGGRHAAASALSLPKRLLRRREIFRLATALG